VTSGVDYAPPDVLHGLAPHFRLNDEGFIYEEGSGGSDAHYEATIERPLPWRYQLRRRRPYPSTVVVPRVCVVCGLNPSTATALDDDATIRRCISFAWAWGCHVYTMVNAYAWRDTKPANMWAARGRGREIVGGRNDAVIGRALLDVERSGGIALAAWGTHCEAARAARLVELARIVGVQWQCLGLNAAGSPKHPLYVANGTPLVPWPRVVEGDVYVDLAEPSAASIVADFRSAFIDDEPGEDW